VPKYDSDIANGMRVILITYARLQLLRSEDKSQRGSELRNR